MSLLFAQRRGKCRSGLISTCREKFGILRGYEQTHKTPVDCNLEALGTRSLGDSEGVLLGFTG